MSMQSIMSASQSLTRMQAMQSANFKMQGQANVLRAESKQDGGNEKKEELAAALDEKSNKLTGDLMSEIADVNETLKPEEGEKTEENEAAKEPKTDKLDLSYSASEQKGAVSSAKIATGEPVTYKADGSKSPETTEKVKKEMDLTA